MTKEIHDINARAVDFVAELIDYIFEYPDDDYMTMECLCRKLVKHGLLDKADGYYQTHDNTEPSNLEKPNNCEPKICDTCRYYNSNIPCGTTPSACKKADKFAEEFVDGLKKLKPKDEPHIVGKHADMVIIDEPQTEMTTEQIVNELLSIKKILHDGKMPKQTHDIRTETHECVKDTHDKTESQTDNGIGCSRCEGRFDCYDRDMPHAVRCNNYGKVTDGKE